jgi:hypothetical protein
MRWLTLLVCAACNQIFGFGDPEVTASSPDARVPDARLVDAGPDAVEHTILITKVGMGEITSDPPLVQCPVDCTSTQVSVPHGSRLQLLARATAGWVSRGFTGGSCQGPPLSSCAVDTTGPQSVGATFAVNDANLVFLGGALAGDFGGIDAADTRCRDDARQAGLGGTFRAVLSATGTNARDRLKLPSATDARGFVRMDGLPFADRASDIFGLAIYYPALYNAQGVPLPADTYYWTGSDLAGNLASNTCNNWTTKEDSPLILGAVGSSRSNVTMYRGDHRCNSFDPFLCAQVEFDREVKPEATTLGKRIFVSDQEFFTGGGLDDANLLCDNSKPSDAGTVVALLATTTKSPASLLDAGTLYLRPDNAIVGTGSEIAQGQLRTGLWQRGNGTYVADIAVWTGSNSIETPCQSGGDQCCGNWTSRLAQKVSQTSIPDAQPTWWTKGPTRNCSQGAEIYCVEQ